MLEARVDDALLSRHRFGVCLPVLCEYEAGLRKSKRAKQNLSRLNKARRVFKFWPTGPTTATEFAELAMDLRRIGHVLATMDHLIAAIARQHDLPLLTADGDFTSVPALRVENWLV
jgi:predicted nucleic acid-binding protein